MTQAAELHVLLVDDDDDVRDAIATGLRLAGFDTIETDNGYRALEHVEAGMIGAIVSDIRMPMLDGRQLLHRVQAFDRELPVILITGHGDIEQAVDAVRNGAYDFLAKPFASDRLSDTVARALDMRSLVLENRRLRSSIGATGDHRPEPLVGTSAAIRALQRAIDQIGQAPIDILIEGEQGTGKRVIAERLHRAGGEFGRSPRLLACEIMSEQAIGDALAGTDDGSGRRSKRPRYAMAPTMNGASTLILDNVEALSSPSQARLMNFLQHNQPGEIGAADAARRARPRIISTSSKDLASLVDLGLFRPDLYFKLAAVKLHVPPLRARRQDIAGLFTHLLRASADRFARPVPTITDPVLWHLTNHDWPGNLRELQNFADQVVLNVGNAPVSPPGPDKGLVDRVANFEKEAIIGALRQTSGNIPKTCAILEIPRKTLYDKIARHKIELRNFRLIN